MGRNRNKNISAGKYRLEYCYLLKGALQGQQDRQELMEQQDRQGQQEVQEPMEQQDQQEQQEVREPMERQDRQEQQGVPLLFLMPQDYQLL